jgi:predicted PurR-regulated permease PerM
MIEFSDRQKKVIAFAVTTLSCAVVFLVVAAVMYGVFSTLAFLSSALVPVLIGYFLALFFKPYYLWWLKTVRNPTVALTLMMSTVLIPLGLFIWHAGGVVIEQISNLFRQGPEIVNKAGVWLRDTFPDVSSAMDKSGWSGINMADLYGALGERASGVGSGIMACTFGAVSVLVTMIFFAYFVMSKDVCGKDIVNQLPFLKEETRDFVAEQIDSFISILVSFFQRQMVICLIEGLLYGLGFALVGLPYGFFIGLLLGVLNLIPFFGSIVCLPIALPLAYFYDGGSAVRVWSVLAVWVSGQFLDGYFITPKIQGNRTGLGYAGVIFSFFFWSTVLGPMLGMLLAIPLSAFCVVLWRAIKFRYIRPVI